MVLHIHVRPGKGSAIASATTIAHRRAADRVRLEHKSAQPAAACLADGRLADRASRREVRGTAEVLLMAIAARRGVVGELSGPGQRKLADHIDGGDRLAFHSDLSRRSRACASPPEHAWSSGSRALRLTARGQSLREMGAQVGCWIWASCSVPHLQAPRAGRQKVAVTAIF